MIQFILGILLMIVVAFLFGKIRGFIFKRVKTTVSQSDKLKKSYKKAQLKSLNSSIGKAYKLDKDGNKIKSFEWRKFKDNFTLGDGRKWGKTLSWWFNSRNWLIIGIIISSIYAYGYFKGRGDTPIKVNLDYTKEFKMRLDGHYLIKPKNSQNLRIEDLKGNIVKNLKAKDFPLLAKKLKPIGFVFQPIGIAGLGAGGVDRGFEGGAGVSFIKYWKWKLDTFLTNRGIYVGTSYQITDNSGLGLGAGKGFKGDNRIILYYKWRF